MASATIIPGTESVRGMSVRVTRRGWNAATDGAAVPYARVGCPPVVRTIADDGNGHAVALSAAATRMYHAVPAARDSAVIIAAAVIAASPDGHGGHVGRVYDGDIIAAMTAGTDAAPTDAAGRMEFRRAHGLTRPAVSA